jgi:hypothetical protein
MMMKRVVFGRLAMAAMVAMVDGDKMAGGHGGWWLSP